MRRLSALGLFASRRLLVSVLFGIFAHAAYAGDLRIPLPQRGRLTPVQRLNRDGVEAVRKQQYQKASELFYKAYLYDPDDPFTLNNLGYMAELQGDAIRAENFYVLASRQVTDAVIDISSLPSLKGKSFRQGLVATSDQTM